MKTNIELARECGAWLREWGVQPCVIFEQAMLDTFAARIRDDERERCALLAESMQHAELCTPVNVAEAIRDPLANGVWPERK